jgi:hypothetical protein
MGAKVFGDGVAIETTKITAVCDRDPQVTDPSVVGIEQHPFISAFISGRNQGDLVVTSIKNRTKARKRHR